MGTAHLTDDWPALDAISADASRRPGGHIGQPGQAARHSQCCGLLGWRTSENERGFKFMIFFRLIHYRLIHHLSVAENVLGLLFFSFLCVCVG